MTVMFVYPHRWHPDSSAFFASSSIRLSHNRKPVGAVLKGHVGEGCLQMGSPIPTETTMYRIIGFFDERVIQRPFVVDVSDKNSFGKKASPYSSGVIYAGCVKCNKAASASAMTSSCAYLLSKWIQLLGKIEDGGQQCGLVKIDSGCNDLGAVTSSHATVAE